MNNQLKYYFLIFTISGFSGLIYESIWSRYLKMFLGHASYAQMLVLIIFMGGMAIGSALAGKYSFKLKKLLVLYAACEFIVGILGITFHGLFTGTMEFTFTNIISNLDSSFSITTVKFLIAGLIILPQSILLGATFPLITSGLLRKYPDNSGTTIAKLYFFNSIGAAIGVISNAFILVPKFGLPGAVMTAGLINILLAIVVYVLDKDQPDASTEANHKKLSLSEKLVFSKDVKILLLIAFATGMASFMYEIAWIRMLSMVLGASTDAFEIMLSAFILGLAIGSWLIRKHIDRIKNIVATLAIIQLLMGVLALLTIPMYSYAFNLMAATQDILSNSSSAYVAFNISSYLICVFIMLPTTICAGTTLPLITNILIKEQKSESSIGFVYSLNTLGAIIGVLVSVQLLMPNFGLKSLVTIGGLLDIGLGLILLAGVTFSSKPLKSILVTSPLAILLAIFMFADLNADHMASGVFRYGGSNLTPKKILFSEHGKASTVAIREHESGERTITNNGKPDATIYIDKENILTDTSKVTTDEPTMILLGALPFIYNNDIKTVANIGFGSGLTSEQLLSNPNITQLDNIEIEQKVIDASKFFAPKVTKVHSDPRSNIIIDDAKTYFVSNGMKYDSIIAEPSNPWVSGVSSLFSKEFYHLASQYLKDDGVYAQWLQTYEISPALIASVYKAMRSEFPFIRLYHVSEGDIAFIATKTDVQPDYTYYDNIESTKGLLNYIGIRNSNDMKIRKIADQRILDFYFNQYSVPHNSDYFPILDNNSAKARFMKMRSPEVFDLSTARILKYIVGEDYLYGKEGRVFSKDNFSLEHHIRKYMDANLILKSVNDLDVNLDDYDYNSRIALVNVKTLVNYCQNQSEVINSREASKTLISWLNLNFAYLPDELAITFIEKIKNQCGSAFTKKQIFEIDAIASFLKADLEGTFNNISSLINELNENEKPSQLIIKLYLAAIAAGYGKKENVVSKLDELDSPSLEDLEKNALVQLVNRRFANQNR